MKNIKNIGLFLGIILILISSFVVDTKRKIPVRTMVVNCETMPIAQNLINIYAKHGYSLVQLSPIVIKLTNPTYASDHIFDLKCTNNFILIMQK
jgi:hypothetical protein